MINDEVHLELLIIHQASCQLKLTDRPCNSTNFPLDLSHHPTFKYKTKSLGEHASINFSQKKKKKNVFFFF